MLKEIEVTVNFIASIVGQRLKDQNKLAEFSATLTHLLSTKIQNSKCWSESQPWRGSSNRCIRIDDRMDPLLNAVAELCNIQNLNLMLPSKFILWIDPNEVCYKMSDSDRAPNTVLYAKESEKEQSINTNTYYNSSNNSPPNSPILCPESPPLSPIMNPLSPSFSPKSSFKKNTNNVQNNSTVFYNQTPVMAY